MTTENWDVDHGCIAVTYDATVADLADRIEAAHQAWDDVACSRLCFEEPVQNDEPADLYRGERRVHWTTGSISSSLLVSSVTFVQDTGLAMGAEVMLTDDDEQRSMLRDQAFLLGAGLASGLGSTSDPSADTVLETAQAPEGGTRTALGADDEIALCALYGTPGYCED